MNDRRTLIRREEDKALVDLSIASERVGNIKAYMRVHAWLNSLGHFQLADRVIDVMEVDRANPVSEKDAVES